MSSGITVNEFKYVPGQNDTEYIRLLKDALKRQEEISSKAVSKIKELSKEQASMSAWIPCNKQLPPPWKSVLCFCMNNTMHVMKLNTDGYWEEYSNMPYYTKASVLAWMPLPLPYNPD